MLSGKLHNFATEFGNNPNNKSNKTKTTMSKKQVNRMFLMVLFSLCSIIANAQGQKASGTIADREGTPIIGATIVEKGTQNATVTDLDGHFSFQVRKGALITISYIGYKSQDVKPTNDPMRITLEEEANGLDEVVVIGYGTTRRKDITGSVASVNADKLNSVSSTSVSQMLQGV